MKGFLEFIKEQGVIGLAVGFILGGAIAKLVASLVSDIINPILGIILGAAKGLDTAYLSLGPAKILYGHFISSLIDFLVIVLVVYYGIRLLRLVEPDKKK